MITKFKGNKVIDSNLVIYKQRRMNQIIDGLMQELEDAIATGTSITVNDSANAPAKLLPSGNTYQETTSISEGDEYDSPSPEHEQTIHNVSGNNQIKVQNKNIWNKDNVSFIDGILDDNGEQLPSVASHYTDNFIKVEPNTSYTFWGQIYSSSIVTKIYFYTKNKEWISRDAGVTNLSVYNFITPINCYYIRVQCGRAVTLKTGDIQLEKGSATSYVEHEEQTLEFTLVEGQKMFLGDYLADDGIHHVRKQIVLDGTEDCSLRSTNENGTYTYLFNGILPEKVKANAVSLSSHYQFNGLVSNGDQTKTKNEGYCLFYAYSSTNKTLYINSTIGNLNDFKAYLAQQYTNETPVTIEYESETETIEPYTELQQTQHNKLKHIISYFGQTNVNIISAGDLEAILNLDYKKSSNIRIKTLEEQNESILNRLALLE